ncbi:MAG: 4Fe-4S dicluster domain-containing protein [Chloroflexi bacterium]|nr:4Fe-4S dicluster domain-containing protein [Chloroflexota bacterium]
MRRPFARQAPPPAAPPPDGPEEELTLRVFRFKPGAIDPPRYDAFRVHARPCHTVIDLLEAVRLEQDESLAFRHSCHHAACGTCAMRINGRERLACVTTVHELRAEGISPVVLEPLRHLPLVSDLVVDMAPFYARWQQVDLPLLRASEPTAPGAEPAAPPTRYEDCLECGACLSACPVMGSDALYMGPAALAAAHRLTEEPRRAVSKDVLALVDHDHGCWRCHTAFECSEVCPNGVQPAERIMRLRRRLLLGRLWPW